MKRLFLLSALAYAGSSWAAHPDENPFAQLNNGGLKKLSKALADDMAGQFVEPDPYKFFTDFDKLLKELNIDSSVVLKHDIPKYNDWVVVLKNQWEGRWGGGDVLSSALSEESTLAIKACFLLKGLEEQQKIANLEKYKDRSRECVVDIVRLNKVTGFNCLFDMFFQGKNLS